MLRSKIFLNLPLKPVENPDLEAYFIKIATYPFDIGLQVGDEFEIQNWKPNNNYQLIINATAGIVKRSLTVIPGEMDNLNQKIDVFQISLYAEIADKEKIDEICSSFIRPNPGMYLEG